MRRRFTTHHEYSDTLLLSPLHAPISPNVNLGTHCPILLHSSATSANLGQEAVKYQAGVKSLPENQRIYNKEDL